MLYPSENKKMEKNTTIIPKGTYLVVCLAFILDDIQWMGTKKKPNKKVGNIEYERLYNPIIPDLHCFRLETNLGTWSHCIKIGNHQVNCYNEIGVLFMIDLDKYPKAYDLLSSDAEMQKNYDIIKIQKNLLNPSIIGIRIPCEECGKKDGCDCTLERQVEKIIEDFHVEYDEDGKVLVKVKLSEEDLSVEDMKKLEDDIVSQFEGECVDIIFLKGNESR